LLKPAAANRIQMKKRQTDLMAWARAVTSSVCEHLGGGIIIYVANVPFTPFLLVLMLSTLLLIPLRARGTCLE
jgi:hypothetical protein